MTIQSLLIGLLIAMGLFATLGWSVARIFQTHGQTRTAHFVHALLILTGMALISAGWATPARVLGGVLSAVALWTATHEPGWSRLLPMIGAAFGLALLLGLPFGGR